MELHFIPLFRDKLFFHRKLTLVDGIFKVDGCVFQTSDHLDDGLSVSFTNNGMKWSSISESDVK